MGSCHYDEQVNGKGDVEQFVFWRQDGVKKKLIWVADTAIWGHMLSHVQAYAAMAGQSGSVALPQLASMVIPMTRYH